MIRSITIHNYRFIEDITIPFSLGIHALIGESGSGKSMFFSAIQCLLQSKDEDCIGAFDDHTMIQVVIDENETTKTLVKTIHESSSTTTLNGSIISISRFISIISTHLVLLTQNGYLYQLQGDALLAYIDADPSCLKLKQQYAPLYQRYNKLKRAIKHIKDKLHDQVSIDGLIESINEIHHAPFGSQMAEDKAKAKEKEYESFQEKNRLYAKYSEFSGELSSLLNGLSRYYALFDPTTFNVMLNAATTLATHLDETTSETMDETIDIDALQQALYKQSQLKRKYHVLTSDQLGEVAKQWQDELVHQQTYQSQYDQYRNEQASIENSLMRIAHQLNIARSMVLSNLKDHLYPLLNDLGLSPLTIHHEFMDKPFSENGNAKLIITLDYNHHMMALDQLSGGEKSRFVLALYALRSNTHGLLLGFDEIDAGLSGRCLAALGNVLDQLGQDQSILILTHHPLIASLASHCFLMVKTNDGSRVKCDLKELKDDDKLNAVAKMNDGSINDQTIAMTKAMMESYGPHHLSHRSK